MAFVTTKDAILTVQVKVNQKMRVVRKFRSAKSTPFEGSGETVVIPTTGQLFPRGKGE